MKTDLGLVMCDFVGRLREAEGNEGEIDKVVQTFIQLVLDKMACRARMTFLRALGARKKNAKPIPVSDHLGQCIDRIVRVGVEGALANGHVTLQDLVALSGHPTALWRLHCALCSPEDDLMVED